MKWGWLSTSQGRILWLNTVSYVWKGLCGSYVKWLGFNQWNLKPTLARFCIVNEFSCTIDTKQQTEVVFVDESNCISVLRWHACKLFTNRREEDEQKVFHPSWHVNAHRPVVMHALPVIVEKASHLAHNRQTVRRLLFCFWNSWVRIRGMVQMACSETLGLF